MGEKEELPRWEQRLINYGKALNRLAEIVNESSHRRLNDFERDSVIKRFEFTFECAWRLMKSYAESQGVQEVGASRDSIRQALVLHTIEDGDSWMGMIKWRNDTAHNYDGEVADAAIEEITQRFYPLMVEYYHKMNSLSNLTPIDLFYS